MTGTARTAGPHVFVAPGDLHGGRAVIRDEDAHHLGRVRRLKPGDAVSIADGEGSLWQGTAIRVDDEIVVSLDEARAAPVHRPSLTVVHALPKGRKLDEVVQRLSEVGVDRLVPVVSERSEVRLDGTRAAKAQRRWDAVAIAAAKQSRRLRPLVVDPVGIWADLVTSDVSGVVLWEDATEPLGALVDRVTAGDPVELTLAVGPEGGLTQAEATGSGLAAASLGSQILRTETAALVAATVLLHRLGRMG